MGDHRRDLPAPHPLQGCCHLYRCELVLELHYWWVLSTVDIIALLTFITGVIVPYMIDPSSGNLGSKVFFIWGGLCFCSIFWAYFFVPETRGLTLEQVDKMMGKCGITDREKNKRVHVLKYASLYRRSDRAQERRMETSRQFHTRDRPKERADRAHGIREAGRLRVALLSLLVVSCIISEKIEGCKLWISRLRALFLAFWTCWNKQSSRDFVVY